MKIFYFIIYYCLATCIITLTTSILNGDYNYFTLGISTMGLLSAITVSNLKKTNLIPVILIWYIAATVIPQTVDFNLIFSISFGFGFSIGGLGLTFNIFFLIPTILIIAYYGQLSLMFKSSKGKVHIENGDIPFGSEINFELNDFEGRTMKGVTDFTKDGVEYTVITFQKMQNSKTFLAKVKVINKEKTLEAIIKLD